MSERETDGGQLVYAATSIEPNARNRPDDPAWADVVRWAPAPRLYLVHVGSGDVWPRTLQLSVSEPMLPRLHAAIQAAMAHRAALGA